MCQDWTRWGGVVLRSVCILFRRNLAELLSNNYTNLKFSKPFDVLWKMIMENSNDNQEQPSAEPPTNVTVDDVDIDFLPIIYDIIRGLERETGETQKPPSGSQDISQKVVELHKKLELAKDQIKRLPGVEYSKEQQLEKLEGLRKQLRLKRELLLKYRTMCSFEVPKI